MVELTRTRILLAVIAVIAVHAIVVTNRRLSHAGDFDISREFGRRLLAHEELYADGLHYPYLPAAALSFAPLALVSPRVGLALRYLGALVCLALTLYWLYDLARHGHTNLHQRCWQVAAATLALALPYIIRDLDDGGPHLILLALVVGGLVNATRGRALLAGVCVGVATAIKAPHGLLIPFFLLNRQTRAAGWSVVTLAICILAPLPWMGAESWFQHHVQWTQTALASVRLAPTTPVAVQSEERVQNQALSAVIRRWVGKLAPSQSPPPSGGDARTGSPPPGGGDTEGAPRTAALIGGLLLLLTTVWFSHGTRPADARWLPNASLILIAAALLSPATWVQHLVLLIPALYVIAARRLTATVSSPLLDAGLILYVVLALVLNRELLGRERYLVLLAGGIHTVAALIVAALVIASNPSRANSPA